MNHGELRLQAFLMCTNMVWHVV